MIKLIIHTSNAAFEEGQKDLEVARILEEAAQKFERGDNNFVLHDINGNSVGSLLELGRSEHIKATGDALVRLEIATDNAAFEDEGMSFEVGRILRAAADKVRDGNYDFKLRDVNGNVVGKLQESAAAEYVTKVDVGSLVGPALDWAVAKCEGHDLSKWAMVGKFWTPSQSWAQANLIIEREKIDIEHPKAFNAGYKARMPQGHSGFDLQHPLTAAMRCYVTSKLGPTVDLPSQLAAANLQSAAADSRPRLYGYYINCDERGSFYADVRNEKGETVFEIKAGNELGEDETSIFDDGYMDNKDDLEGLRAYLIELGVIPKNAELYDSRKFEYEVSLRKSNRDDSFEP